MSIGVDRIDHEPMKTTVSTSTVTARQLPREKRIRPFMRVSFPAGPRGGRDAPLAAWHLVPSRKRQKTEEGRRESVLGGTGRGGGDGHLLALGQGAARMQDNLLLRRQSPADREPDAVVG